MASSALSQRGGVRSGFYCDPHSAATPPDAPYPSIYTEAWSGWFQGAGGSPGHRPASDLAYAIAKFVAEGGTAFSYYMLQGGTNFGRTAGASIATSYDYDAPISEWGFPRQPKFGLLQKLHAALHKYEAAIVGTEPLQWWSQGVAGMPGLSLHPYGDAVSFLVNANATTNYKTRLNCSSAAGGESMVSVPMWSVSIVDGVTCDVVFNTAADPDSTPPPPPSEASTGAPSDGWEFWTEPLNLSWCKDAEMLSSLPEQIDFTGGPLVTDYMQASVELPAAAANATLALTAMDRPVVGGPLGGVHHVDGCKSDCFLELTRAG